MKHRLRGYVNTSVFGGCLDEEYKSASLTFFSEAGTGRFCVVLSPTTLRDLARATEAFLGCEPFWDGGTYNARIDA